MAILIAGGKGFIGSQVIGQLLALGEEVVCLEPRGTPGRLGDLQRQVPMETGSVANFDEIRSVFRKHAITKVAGLVFFAFRGNPERLHDEMSIMIQGTANLFEAARLHGVQRVVFPSSIAYYGPQSFSRRRRDRPERIRSMPGSIDLRSGKTAVRGVGSGL